MSGLHDLDYRRRHNGICASLFTRRDPSVYPGFFGKTLLLRSTKDSFIRISRLTSALS
jgi:hypothetical protein